MRKVFECRYTNGKSIIGAFGKPRKGVPAFDVIKVGTEGDYLYMTPDEAVVYMEALSAALYAWIHKTHNWKKIKR